MARRFSTRTGFTGRALLALALLALTSILLPAAALAPPAASPVMDIADVRSLPLGSTVTVKASVTTPSGAFVSSTFDQGFAIQDSTGGIYVSIATDLDLAPRQKVRVTGRLADSFGLRILVVGSPGDIKTLGVGPRVGPRPVATGAIGEATEGVLVTVVGTITQPVVNDLPFGYLVVIDDGSGATRVFVSASTGIDVSGLAVGQQLRVTGLSSQFGSKYEVLPRAPGDVQMASGSFATHAATPGV